MNSKPHKTPTKEMRLSKQLKFISPVKAWIKQPVEREELRPENRTTFATILSPLETLDVKKVVSKGNNMVKPAEDEQQPINLESKMSEAINHGELELLIPLAEPDVVEQVITEASERSAFRPSRRDTNSPEEFEPVSHGIAQDFRGRTRPGQV